MKRIALASLFALATFSAVSAPVYRCGNTYSQTPCAGAAIVETDDSRTAAQWAEAKTVAADERRLGREMERERLAIEARAAVGPAALSSARVIALPVPKAVVRKAKAKQRRYVALEQGPDFIAVAPRRSPR